MVAVKSCMIFVTLSATKTYYDESDLTLLVVVLNKALYYPIVAGLPALPFKGGHMSILNQFHCQR